MSLICRPSRAAASRSISMDGLRLVNLQIGVEKHEHAALLSFLHEAVGHLVQPFEVIGSR